MFQFIPAEQSSLQSPRNTITTLLVAMEFAIMVFIQAYIFLVSISRNYVAIALAGTVTIQSIGIGILYLKKEGVVEHGLVHQRGLTIIPTWITNHMRSKV